MKRASWNGQVIAESNDLVVVEGNDYFPQDSLKKEFFKATEHHTTCAWKGVASYFDIEVAGKVNAGAAWYYPTPSAAAKNIEGRVAFWRGVVVSEVK
jgi:uncharacterized protein (DUF427 family)